MSETVLRDFGQAYPLPPLVNHVIHDHTMTPAEAWRVVWVGPKGDDGYYPVGGLVVEMNGVARWPLERREGEFRWSTYYTCWRRRGAPDPILLARYE